MSILFDDASSEYLGNASAVLTAVPISMACWFYSDSLTVNQSLISLADASASNQAFAMYAAGNRAGDKLSLLTFAGSTDWCESSSAYTANTWHHACGVWAAINDRTVYLDGGNSGTSSVSRTPTGIDRTGIGLLYRSSPSAYMSGRIAEVAMWNVALTAAEAAILAKGFSPLFVRPASLVAYWPLVGQRDPAIDRIANYDMTWYNTPVVAAHPRIIQPRQSQIGVPESGAPPAATGYMTTNTGYWGQAA